MARRHIMRLRVGDEIVIVETAPAPPAGYSVLVERAHYGLAPRIVFDQVRNTTQEAADLFAAKCHEIIDELAKKPAAGVLQRPSRIVQLEDEEEVWHG